MNYFLIRYEGGESKIEAKTLDELRMACMPNGQGTALLPVDDALDTIADPVIANWGDGYLLISGSVMSPCLMVDFE